MDAVASRILSAKRKRLFGLAPLFNAHKRVTESELTDLERQLHSSLPESLRGFLLTAGYGDINEVLSLRKEWFNVIDRGELTGHVIFAQDILGNFYTFSPTDGGIHFVCRSSPEYAFMAEGFDAFLQEFERRAFQLEAWTDSLNALPYHWSV